MFWDSKPPHPAHLFIHHETKSERNVALEGLSGQSYSSDSRLFFKEFSQGSDNIWSASVYLKVELVIFLLFWNIPVDINSMDWL